MQVSGSRLGRCGRRRLLHASHLQDHLGRFFSGEAVLHLDLLVQTRAVVKLRAKRRGGAGSSVCRRLLLRCSPSCAVQSGLTCEFEK